MTSVADAPGAVETTVDVAARTVRLTNLDRVLWPVTGATKRDLIGYLLAAAPVLLPHVARRAVMLWRFPEGVDGPGWFQAQCRSRPEWVGTHEIVGRRGERLRYCLVEEPATLAWLGNLGTIELHPHGWTIDRPAEPSALQLDLDPGPPAGHRECARVAVLLRERLGRDGLRPVVKTSGGLGLHVAVPLASRQTFDAAKAYARSLAEELAASEPELVVFGSARAQRTGRVYVDWIQNDAGRQMVAPYSLRATPVPQVSTPVSWDEVEAASRGMSAALRPGPREVLERVERLGDLWASDDRGTLPR